MAAEDEQELATPVDEVMEEIRRELVRRAAAADREENRDVYDALERE
ncbi:MAG: hypothetical protein V5A33_05900 [Halobacteriales archaeon]